MRGSLVILAALCVVVVAVAEASSVRFVSVDEGHSNNGKVKKEKNETSERSDSNVKKSIDDMVKKINDGVIQSEKTVKNVELDKSADNGSESARETAKKSAVPDKAKIQKRDVRRALDMLAKRAMKRVESEEADSGWNIFNIRKILIKYLTMQKTVVSKVIASLSYGVEHMETDQKEQQSLLGILNQFKTEMEQVYDTAIQQLQAPTPRSKADLVSQRRKFFRADEIPSVITTLNQRNPLALIPVFAKLVNAISGAATIADIASSISSRSNSPDLGPVLEPFQKLISSAMQLPLEADLSDY